MLNNSQRGNATAGGAGSGSVHNNSAIGQGTGIANVGSGISYFIQQRINHRIQLKAIFDVYLNKRWIWHWSRHWWRNTDTARKSCVWTGQRNCAWIIAEYFKGNHWNILSVEHRT